MAHSIDDRSLQAVCAFNLGIAYSDVLSLSDFDAAERWLRQSLDLRPSEDALGRGKSLGQLGNLAVERFDALEKHQRQEEGLRCINDAARYFQAALELFPPSAIRELGVSHHQLGGIFSRTGDIDRALRHYQQSIRYSEQAGDDFGAGETRFNIAVALFQVQRFDDARAYANEAVINFRRFGDRAAGYIGKVESLVALIDEARVTT